MAFLFLFYESRSDDTFQNHTTRLLKITGFLLIFYIHLYMNGIGIHRTMRVKLVSNPQRLAEARVSVSGSQRDLFDCRVLFLHLDKVRQVNWFPVLYSLQFINFLAHYCHPCYAQKAGYGTPLHRSNARTNKNNSYLFVECFVNCSLLARKKHAGYGGNQSNNTRHEFVSNVWKHFQHPRPGIAYCLINICAQY